MAQMSQAGDLTSGPMLKKIILFSLPLAASSILQLLFNAADVVVVGRFAGSTALARKIGAAVENNRIVTDGKMQTTVPGLYAAGDCTGGLLQVAKAVYEAHWRAPKPPKPCGNDPDRKRTLCPAAQRPFIALLSSCSRIPLRCR